jgi:site-specific recombinase XerD
MSDVSIQEAMQLYLNSVRTARSPNTARAYRNALGAFVKCLKERQLNLDSPVDGLDETPISWFAVDLKDFSPATESLYLTAIAGLYEFLAAERLAEVNLPRLRLLIRQRSRRQGVRLPQFSSNNIEEVLDYALKLAEIPAEDLPSRLRNLRDRAFLICLADTGLRVHEACRLRRGDLDWHEMRAVIIGKGDRQAVVRFSSRSVGTLRDYQSARQQLDGAAGRPLSSLPLFARHDRGAGRKIKPISTATGRNIVTARVEEALGKSAVGSITPHSFRHYFVTSVLRGSGGNLKLAQKLARHENIQVTQRYAHLSDDELDQGYAEIFNPSQEPP